GANDYIVKPIDPDMFLAKVTSLLDKRPNPYTFKKFPAHSSFEISYHLEVIALGEQGIDLVTPIPLKVDSKMMIDCPLFTKVGIGTAHVRIAATRPNPNDESQFFSTANFIGLSDNALQMIRRWVMKQDTAVKAS
ncbi:MAG: hypothetical protein KDD25_08775, partial [Bdellovibrionales bacterium]|nr:hypothetical protein [Bdellovibrionales bacterium]